MTKKNKTLMLLLFISVLCISSCTKPAATPLSIVGTWNATSIDERLLANNVTLHDSVVQIPSGSYIFSFNSAGYYTIFNSTHTTGSGYFLNGDTLRLFDTVSNANTWDVYVVKTLTANSLALQVIPFTYGDSVYQFTENFTR